MLLRQSLTAAAVTFVVIFSGNISQSALAKQEDILIQMPVQKTFDVRDFMAQAELLVSNSIKQKFSQNPDVTLLQVVLLGDRNGEIIPIFTTTVSRTQWQENPQVKTWSKYYRASYALLQRFPQGLVAAVPSAIDFQSRKSEDYLTGAEAQKNLSSID